MTEQDLNGFTIKEMIKMILDDNKETRELIEEMQKKLDVLNQDKVGRKELYSIFGLGCSIALLFLYM